MVTFRNNNNSNRRSNFRRNDRNFKSNGDRQKFSSNFTNNHNLKSGQPLIYDRNDYPALGIGTYAGNNNPFNPGNDELVPGATYYPQVLGISSVFLYRTEKDYNAGINTIGYTAVTGKNIGLHKFKVKYAKNTLNSVSIIDAGGTFENRSVFVKPEKISTNFSLT